MLVAHEKWSIEEMTLSVEKLQQLWKVLQKHKTLFTDLTRGDPANFLRTVMAPGTMWFEIREHKVLIGIIWFGDIQQVVDCTGHMVFFDRRPAEKAPVCRKLMGWMFNNLPMERITVTPPVIYHGTIRLLEHLGFFLEGRRYRAVPLGGKWVDQCIYGITRNEFLTGEPDWDRRSCELSVR